MAITLLSLFFMSSLSIVASPSWKTSSTSSDGPSVAIHVKDAYYFNADGDGLQDDTFASIELTIVSANRINFEYWITLTLPSGNAFQFGLQINTVYTYLELNHTMYNTALEAGWYNLHVEVVLKTGGISYTDAHHVFDPPGDGQEGAPPFLSTSLSGS